MTPAARTNATIELLDSMLTAWRGKARYPADKLLDQYFKARRYIGSHDRGAISEAVYWTIRHMALLEWWCARLHTPVTARTLTIGTLILRKTVGLGQIATLFGGGQYAPTVLTDGEWNFARELSRHEFKHDDMPHHVRLNYPAWMEAQLRASLGPAIGREMEAMHEQAPVDIRTNTLKISRGALLEKLNASGFEAEAAPLSPHAIRLKKRAAIFGSELFKEGLFEMQDAGSQAVCAIVDAAPSMKVIDFCAGAGGKTLALAAQMENKGRILAWDNSPKRLAQLPLRLKRAGVHNTESRVITSESDAFIKRHKQTADRVLIDVPCSGSGTWRRNPDLKWRFTEHDLQEVMLAQQNIFQSAARLVKVGGRLIYATCSLLRCENETQVETFLASHANFRVVCAQKIWNKISGKFLAPGESSDSSQESELRGESGEPVSYLCLTPHQDGVDGFFAAVLERISA